MGLNSLNLKIFIDSDVVISSIKSNTGAAHELILHPKGKLFTSDWSIEEVERGCLKLNLKWKTAQKIFKQKFNTVNLDLKKIDDYSVYTLDPDDSAIIYGAVKSKCHFLITYNLKDYKITKLKNDFGITIFTPAQFLQYLRSK